MALFRAVRFSHQMRVRRMLLHHVARRNRAAAQLPEHATMPDVAAANATAAVAAAQTVSDDPNNAVSVEAPPPPRRRTGGRRRRQRSAHLTADQVAEAVVADEEAAAAGRGSLGLAELLSGLVEDDLATTPAQNRAVRNVLRRRRRGGVVATQGVTARKGTSRRLTAFDNRSTPARAAAPQPPPEKAKRVQSEFVSPSHPYFALLRASEAYAPEAVLPQAYYGFAGRLPSAKPRPAGTSSTPATPPPTPSSAGPSSAAVPWPQTYDAKGSASARAVQRAAARHAFFTSHLQKEGCGECVTKSVYRLRHEWRRLTSRQKNTYVPETVRGAVLAAAHGEELGDQVPHVATVEDDCVLVPPTDGMRTHHIDADAEALPHFYALQPRSTLTRLVRTPFQLFTDAHIDTARAEVEAREAKARAAEAKAKASAGETAAATSEASKEVKAEASAPLAGDDETRAVFTSHAITRAAVQTLAEAWTELRPSDKHAYANMAEGFTTSSKRYFDAAFAQLRKLHRHGALGSEADDVDVMPYDAADALVPALLKRGRPQPEPDRGNAWVRLPVSPVVRRRQERCNKPPQAVPEPV